jgi:predicted Rossmann fold nucleotide-binding protein DprA/Smf involved in DNA uptake
LRAFDWIKTLPPVGVAVVSGFHSPIEQECLSLLLRRGIAVVVCPAREISHYRYPEPWEHALASGQLLMLSPFATYKRATVVLAEKRNTFVAALADALVVIHAPEGSRTRAAVEQAADKPVTELC